MLKGCLTQRGGEGKGGEGELGVGHSLMWPIWGRAAGQGMVYDLSALNRV